MKGHLLLAVAVAKRMMLSVQIPADIETAAIDLRHQVVMLGWGSALSRTVLWHFEEYKAIEQLEVVVADLSWACCHVKVRDY